ncbi:MAG: DMT family transporter [Candidatus Pacebacteria bacterium]|nr:DMT family transporter [Candidatus Paceibacterota bacterium]
MWINGDLAATPRHDDGFDIARVPVRVRQEEKRTRMYHAIALNIVLGLLWATLGIIMSSVARRGESILFFYAVGSLLVALAGWTVVVDWEVLLAGDAPRLGNLLLAVAIAGGVNGLAQFLMVSTMRRGHQGVTWAIGQSAMVIPFVASVIIWHEEAPMHRWLGITLLVTAIMLMGWRRNHEKAELSSDPAWFWFALLTLCVIGTSQVAAGIPSRWPDWSDAANLRMPVFVTAGAFVHSTVLMARRMKVSGGAVKLALPWAGVAVVAYLILFKCLDWMGEYGLVGIVYPIGIGTCIVAFSLYSGLRLREKFTPAICVGLVLAVAGIALIAL